MTLGCAANLGAPGGSGQGGGSGGGGRVHVAAATLLGDVARINVAGGQAGNPGAPGVITTTVEPTPLPLPGLTPSTLPDGKANVLYRQVLTVADGTGPYTFAVTGLPEGLTATPDGATLTISGTPTAGGTASLTVTVTDSLGCSNAQQTYSLNIIADTTPPVITATISGQSRNNWYTSDVQVSWEVTDTESTITTKSGCETQIVSADTAGVTFTCEATNSAGLKASVPVTIKRDATPPTASLAVSSGTLGTNGWYTSDVTVTTTGTDALSTPTCTGIQSLTTDSAETTFTGQCTDAAGNTTQATPLSIKRDATPPSASIAVSSGTLGTNGWYRSDVTLTTTGTDGLSGVANCTAAQTLATDHPGKAFSGQCKDQAGNTSPTASVTVKRDTTPPSVVLTPSGTLGLNGWYVSDVTVTTSGTDAVSGVASCTGPQSLTTDSAGTAFTGSCTDNAGNSGSNGLTVKRDATKPSCTVSATPNTLWPPNHKLATIATTVTPTDTRSGVNGFVLNAVTSNEPDSGIDLADVPNDIQGWTLATPDTSGQLRAERAGGGTGRTYTLRYQVSDKAGNTGTCSALVSVPRNQ